MEVVEAFHGYAQLENPELRSLLPKALINKMLLVSQILTYFSVIVQPEESLVTIFLVDESKMAKK